jgi:cellulose synthase/poly-beta-1,6-N-acetylglucosamine synthase-like glycosyltransferase
MLFLFLAALAVQLIYWLLIAGGLDSLRRDDEPPAGASDLPISVVIAARDEERNLPDLVAALQAQTHANFEAIVVDDGSRDGTAETVRAAASRDPRFRLVSVEAPRDPRKKHALATGIAAARHDRLAFTDADCTPPAGWLAAIAAAAAQDPDAVLVGHGPYRQRPGALNALVRYETLVTAALTAAAVGLGRPYMAVGRNFSYPRSLFDRIGGFEHQMHSLSGDDDLLVQEARRHGAPVRYLLDPGSFVPTDAPPGWRAWLRQKSRHTSAGLHYDRGAQAHLAAFHGSAVLVWLSPLALEWTGAGLLAIRFLVQRLVLKRAAEALHADQDLMIYQPLLEVGYMLYISLLAPAGALFGGKKW